MALEQKKRKRHHQLKHAEFHLGDIVALGDKLKPVDASGTADRLRELRLVQIREHSQLAMYDEATDPDVLQIYHVPVPFDKHPRVGPSHFIGPQYFVFVLYPYQNAGVPGCLVAFGHLSVSGMMPSLIATL